MPVTFVVFDILRYRGKDLREMPLMQRKQILTNANLPNNPRIQVVPFIETAGEALFSDICAREMEGIVCKRKDRYVCIPSI